MDSEILSSHDTLQVLLTGFAEAVKLRNHTGLWYAKLTWYFPSATHRICWGCEGDKPHWTVRCQAHLILSKCYSPDLLRLWRWQTSLDCEMSSSPDTLQVLLTRFVFMVWRTASESIVLDLPDLAWLSRFLQPQRNFFSYLIIVINCNFIFCSTNICDCFGDIIAQFELVKPRIRRRWTFICVAFKPNSECRNALRIRVPTTRILSTTTDTLQQLELLQS